MAATPFFAALGHGQLVLPTAPVDFLDCLNDRLALEIQLERSTDLSGLVFIDYDLSAVAIVVVTKRCKPTALFAFATSGRHLVSCSFLDDLSFELGEREEYV